MDGLEARYQERIDVKNVVESALLSPYWEDVSIILCIAVPIVVMLHLVDGESLLWNYLQGVGVDGG